MKFARKLIHGMPVHLCYRPRSEGDNVLGSIRLSVRLSVWMSVCALKAEPFDIDLCDCLCMI